MERILLYVVNRRSRMARKTAPSFLYMIPCFANVKSISGVRQYSHVAILEHSGLELTVEVLNRPEVGREVLRVIDQCSLCLVGVASIKMSRIGGANPKSSDIENLDWFLDSPNAPCFSPAYTTI